MIFEICKTKNERVITSKKKRWYHYEEDGKIRKGIMLGLRETWREM